MHDPKKRKVDKVPFVELYNGRLQGVVSSGSDIRRVYVSLVETSSFGYNCRTNNNRPCGGLHGSPCKHIQALIDNAVAQYGPERVARYLKLPGDIGAYDSSKSIMIALKEGCHVDTPVSEVFSRFLNYLRYVEFSAQLGPAPEMRWFAPSGEDSR